MNSATEKGGQCMYLGTRKARCTPAKEENQCLLKSACVNIDTWEAPGPVSYSVNMFRRMLWIRV